MLLTLSLETQQSLLVIALIAVLCNTGGLTVQPLCGLMDGFPERLSVKNKNISAGSVFARTPTH